MIMTCRSGLESCSANTCFHSAQCLSPFYNEIRCNCSQVSNEYKLGHRCQWLKRTFSPTKPYQYYSLGSPPLSCDGWHISFEYLSKKERTPQNSTLFYAGPELATINNAPILAVQLNNDEPELVVGSNVRPIPIGNPRQDEIKWHRIDLIVSRARVNLIQNLCSFPLHQEIQNPRCHIEATIDETLFYNSQTRLYLGGRPDIGPTLLYPASFSGCIKNLQINSQTKGLDSPTEDSESQNDCAIDTKSCGLQQCGYGNCEGPQENQKRGQCICQPGYMKKTNSEQCSVATESFRMSINSGAQWTLQAGKDWENRRAPNGRSFLPLQFRYRTVTKDAVLLNMVGWTDEEASPSRQVFITIGVRDGVLTSSYRLTSPETVVVLNLTSTVNASDGRWHNVQYIRSGPTITLKLDHGEAENYAFYYDRNVNVNALSRINNITQLNIGSLAFDGSTANNLSTAEKNVFSGCMDDIRVFQTNYKLCDVSVKSTPDLSTPNIKSCGDLCKDVSCAVNQECVDVWPIGRCRPRFNCNLENVCLNGGVCAWSPTVLSYACTCARGFVGERCDTAVVASSLQWWWILLVILLFLLLLLIFGCIYCFCCGLVGGGANKEDVVTSKELDLPPEKVASCNTQGAGEVDFRGLIDFSWFKRLRMASADGKLDSLSPPNAEKVDPVFDYPLEYAYEGRGLSPVPSISSIVSTNCQHREADEPLELPYMCDWGPQFQAISSIYHGTESQHHRQQQNILAVQPQKSSGKIQSAGAGHASKQEIYTVEQRVYNGSGSQSGYALQANYTLNTANQKMYGASGHATLAGSHNAQHVEHMETTHYTVQHSGGYHRDNAGGCLQRL